MVMGITDPRSLSDPKRKFKGVGQGDRKPLALKRRQIVSQCCYLLGYMFFAFTSLFAHRSTAYLKGKIEVSAIFPDGSRSGRERERSGRGTSEGFEK